MIKSVTGPTLGPDYCGRVYVGLDALCGATNQSNLGEKQTKASVAREWV